MKKNKKKKTYSPQKHEWGTNASAKFARDMTPGQDSKKTEKPMKRFSEIYENLKLNESHFEVGQKVKCKASGMTGTVTKVDPEEKGKYYTVKRSDGKVMKYAPDELTAVQKECVDLDEAFPYRDMTDTGAYEESQMAVRQLHFIQYAAEEIMEYVEMRGDLDEWFQNKLSAVHSKMQGLHSFTEGDKRAMGMDEESKEGTIRILDLSRKYQDPQKMGVVFTEELKIDEGQVAQKRMSRSDFEKLKKGSLVDIAWDGAMSAGAGSFVVVSKSKSKKYDVEKVKLQSTDRKGGAPFYLYSRKGGDATLAIGDMGATMTKYKIVK